jgi:hypothetical protein
VTVPAGTFDAYVIEITTSTEASMAGAAFKSTSKNTVYAAEKVGIVRYVIDTSVSQASGSPEPSVQKDQEREIDEMDQTIEALQQGENSRKLLEDAAEEAQKRAQRKMTGELQRYRIK